jgi:hypothetical protein
MSTVPLLIGIVTVLGVVLAALLVTGRGVGDYERTAEAMRSLRARLDALSSRYASIEAEVSALVAESEPRPDETTAMHVAPTEAPAPRPADAQRVDVHRIPRTTPSRANRDARPVPSPPVHSLPASAPAARLGSGP